MRCILLGHLASSGVGSGHFCRARPRLCLEALLPLEFCEEVPKAAGAVAYRVAAPLWCLPPFATNGVGARAVREIAAEEDGVQLRRRFRVIESTVRMALVWAYAKPYC